MFQLNPHRRFIYAFVTDLSKCRLMQVNSSILRPRTHPITAAVRHSLNFSWYDVAKKQASGLYVLAILSNMTNEQLGMSCELPPNLELEVSRCLGTGANSAVYSFQGEPSKVLKIPLQSASDTDGPSREQAALRELQRRRGTVSTRASSSIRASGASPEVEDGAFDGRRHVPRLVEYGHALPEGVFMLEPLASKLTLERLQSEHIDQLFDVLQWAHLRCWLHGDISYRNLMLAPADWQLGASSQGNAACHQVPLPVSNATICTCYVVPTSLLLIDWGFAHTLGSASEWAYHGTLLSMSQRTLAACIASSPEIMACPDASGRWNALADGTYGVKDELESAVKSMLLLLSPVLKRSIKHRMASTSRTQAIHSSVTQGAADKIELWHCWQRLLAHHPDLQEHLNRKAYKQLADWLKSASRLHFLAEAFSVDDIASADA